MLRENWTKDHTTGLLTISAIIGCSLILGLTLIICNAIAANKDLELIKSGFDPMKETCNELLGATKTFSNENESARKDSLEFCREYMKL